MNFITIALTTSKRMPPPAPQPDITRPDAVSWFSGWWHGIAVGTVIGAGIGVMLAKAF
jgi:hypothetical protein